MTKLAILGGAGHVGLPFGLALRREGFTVGLFDQNKDVLRDLQQGHIPFKEFDAEKTLKSISQNDFHIEIEDENIRHYNILVSCIPVTHDEDTFSKLRPLLSYLNPNSVIIIRSTMPVGSTRQLITKLIEQGFSNIAYCPERMLQGEGLKEIKEIPQIYYAHNSFTEKAVHSVFSKITNELIALPLEEVEFTKIMCNSWRYQEFAIANQFYMLAEEKGLSFNRILQAAKKNYPRADHFRSAGLTGGPCLPKDHFFINQLDESLNFMGSSAQKVHEHFPEFLVEQLENKLTSLKEKKVLILGVAYKGNSDDIRKSRALEIVDILKRKGSTVILSDPFLFPDIKLEQALEQADGILIGCPHSQYQSLQIKKPFVDCWNIIGES